MVWGRIASRIGQNPGLAGGAGLAGFGLGEATDFFGLDLADGSGGDGPLSGLFGGMTIVWVFAGIALLAVVSDLSGD